MTTRPRYGFEDTTYRAAGGTAGIVRLVDAFYRIMSTDPAYAPIWHWHSASAQPDMLADTADRLSSFLIGWMGGPRVYQEKFGPISIPGVHAHLPVSATERDMWLGCMAAALEEQSYPEHLRTYLLEQLAKPANMIMARAQHREA